MSPLERYVCGPFRYWRRTLGLQVRFADCGGYRFCYASRGKPGTRPSILMLHGFSAHKDTWLTVVKVRFLLGTVKGPDLSACGMENFSLKCVFCVTSVPSIVFPSTSQSICTSCVWTCPAMRGRRAPTPMTTPFRGRSGGFDR